MPEIFYIVPEDPAQRPRRRRLPASRLPRPTKPPTARASAPRPPATASARTTRIKALHLDHLFGSGSAAACPGRRSRSEALAIRGRQNLERQQETRPGHRLRARWTPAMQARRQIRRRHRLRRQRLPLSLGRRLRDGRREERLHRLHQLHRGARRGRAVRRQVPHARHQPALVGLPDHDADRLSRSCIDWATSVVAMGRVQQLKREGKQLPPARRRRRGRQPDHRSERRRTRSSPSARTKATASR